MPLLPRQCPSIYSPCKCPSHYPHERCHSNYIHFSTSVPLQQALSKCPSRYPLLSAPLTMPFSVPLELPLPQCPSKYPSSVPVSTYIPFSVRPSGYFLLSTLQLPLLSAPPTTVSSVSLELLSTRCLSKYSLLSAPPTIVPRCASNNPSSVALLQSFLGVPPTTPPQCPAHILSEPQITPLSMLLQLHSPQCPSSNSHSRGRP